MMQAIIRRLTAMLMVLVITLAPLIGTSSSASARAGSQLASAEKSGMAQNLPKPCKRAALPGALNTCPFAGLGLTAIPAGESIAAQPFPIVQAVAWGARNDALPPQCGASSLYRPPCQS